MNRRDFLKTGLIGGVGLAVVGVSPAKAAHVTESKEPVIGAKLSVYKYGASGTTLIRVDTVIPEDGVQPPGSTPVTIQYISDASTGGVLLGTAQGYETRTFSPELPVDATTGLRIVDFDNMRVEPGIMVKRAARQAGTPSEHMDEEMKYGFVQNVNRQNESFAYDWHQPWKHSNVPPHAPFKNGFWESAQGNQKLTRALPGEVVRFEHLVIGLETRVRFLQTVTFLVA